MDNMAIVTIRNGINWAANEQPWESANVPFYSSWLRNSCRMFSPQMMATGQQPCANGIDYSVVVLSFLVRMDAHSPVERIAHMEFPSLDKKLIRIGWLLIKDAAHIL